jgi:hypothetical protein
MIVGRLSMFILWLCNKSFKPFRSFRIELNSFLQNIETKLLTRYYKYEINKKAKSGGIK